LRALVAKRAHSILNLKDTCTNEALCFLSLRSERVIRAFDTHSTVAKGSFHRAMTSRHARRFAPDVFLSMFSSVCRVGANVRPFLSK
jgi:hypothetical protein